MYIRVREGLGDAPSSKFKRVTERLLPKPPYLPYLILDGFMTDKWSLTDGSPEAIRLSGMVSAFTNKVILSSKTTHPIAGIRLIGHTDNTGREQYNKGLGDRRALAVKIALQDKLKGLLGLVPDIVVEPGPGYSKPRADNDTPEGRAANRRVEVFITTRDVTPPPLPPPFPPTVTKEPAPPVIRTTPGPYPWGKLPTLPPRKSLENWLDEQLKRLPQGRRIRDAVLKGSCFLLEDLFRRKGGTLSEKQKEDFRKQCRERAKRPI